MTLTAALAEADAEAGAFDVGDAEVGAAGEDGAPAMVGVARALMGDAKCLLLDEPMAGVEGQAYQAMQRVVREVAESGVAVCVVEHNISFVRDLCDEGVFMFAGAIMARGPVAELIRNPQLTELYFGH